MWQHFLDTADTKSELIPEQDSTLSASNPVSLQRPILGKPKPAPLFGTIYCPRCNENVYYETLDEHNQDTLHMSQILPWLSLGAGWNATNANEIHADRIGTIVCMAAELTGKKPFINSGIQYKSYLLEDDEREFALTTFMKSTVFLEGKRQSIEKTKEESESIQKSIVPDRVLVHCVQGRSRSVSAVVAYLMFHQKLSSRGALNRVQALHRGARPISGYLKQLDILDSIYRLCSYSVRLIDTIADFLPPHGLND